MRVLSQIIPVSFTVFLHSAYSSRRPRPHDYTVEAQLEVVTALPLPVYCKPNEQTAKLPVEEHVVTFTWFGRRYSVPIPNWDMLMEAKRLLEEGKRAKPQTIINRIAKLMTDLTYSQMPKSERITKKTLFANFRSLLYNIITTGRKEYTIFKVETVEVRKYAKLMFPLTKLRPHAVQQFNTAVLNAVYQVIESWFEAPLEDNGLEWSSPIDDNAEGLMVGSEVTSNCNNVIGIYDIADISFIEDYTYINGASYSKSNAYEITAPEHPYWTDKLSEYANEHLRWLIDQIIDAYEEFILPALKEVLGV